MSKILSNKYLILISRIIVGGVFVFAAADKISDPSSFSKAIYNYKLFPDVLVNLFAVIIPWIEIVAGILLIFGIYARENAVIINSLLSMFIIIVIISIFRGLNIDCGCYGTASGSMVGWQKVGENVLLILLGFHVIFFSKDPMTVNSFGMIFPKEEI
ncbi:MAG: MauE/DoxX family redox-associated membrane protein [Ignavibacteriaceae bacterium]